MTYCPFPCMHGHCSLIPTEVLSDRLGLETAVVMVDDLRHRQAAALILIRRRPPKPAERDLPAI